MTQNANSLRQIKFILIATVTVAAMYVGAEFLQPVALAVLLTFVLMPVVRRLERLNIPRLPAILITLTLAFAVVGGIGYVVGRQFMALADKLPEYEQNILAKTQMLQPAENSPLTKAARVAKDVRESLAPTPEANAPPVRVVTVDDPLERYAALLGPFHSIVGFGGVVLILLFFLMLQGDEIRDRIIQLGGRRQISLTTRTLTQITARLSRYLTSFALFNTGVGIFIAVGLWLIGLPYFLLWGAIAGLMRFVPYLGPAVAFALPALFSFAHFTNWWGPLEVLALFAVEEMVASSVEPFIYGKSTGVSAVGLLVAAMFWTWLWGAVGLLLSTPLTVCLTVIGRHIPSLGFLADLLGEEVDIPEDVKLYQRLLQHDQDAAITLLDEAIETRPAAEVFDRIVIPALSRASRDQARETVEPADLEFLWGVIGQWLDELEEDGLPEIQISEAEEAEAETAAAAKDKVKSKTRAIETKARADGQSAASAPSPAPLTPSLSPLVDGKAISILGVASNNIDVLVLRMVNLLLSREGMKASIFETAGSTLAISEQIQNHEPDLILVSYLPPVGLTQTRYLIRRLRARLPETPLLVGYWQASADPVEISEILRPVGAYRVSLSVGEVADDVRESLVAPSKPVAAVS
jgi:predicted PurR-regulated permease PerM